MRHNASLETTESEFILGDGQAFILDKVMVTNSSARVSLHEAEHDSQTAASLQTRAL